MDSTNAMLEAALECVRRGWAVLPVWWVNANRSCGCGSAHEDRPRDIGKHPVGLLVPQGVKGATKDERLVRDWWKQYPEAAIGVATGAPSGFDVLDVDGEAGRATVALWERQGHVLPETVEQISGSGGRHVLLRHTPVLKNWVGFALGVDLRTTGGYIVVAPSPHRSGGRYAWDEAHHPDEARLAECPSWLKSQLPTAKVAAPRTAPAALAPQPTPVVERARKYLAQIEGAVSGSRGHSRTFRAACAAVRGFALPLEQALPLLQEWNERCMPPWSEKELLHKLDGAVNGSGPVGNLLNAPAPTSLSRKRSKARARPHQPNAARTTRPDGAAGGTPMPAQQPTVRCFQRGDHAELADHLLDDLNAGREMLVHDEARIHVYSPASGLWIPQDPPALRARVKGFAGAPVAPQGKPLKIKLPDAQGAVALAGDVVHRAGFFGDAPAGVAFEDGFVAIVGRELPLVRHAAENRARWAYPFNLASGSACPQFLGFLTETFHGEPDQAERIACIQEFAGACILGIAPRYQKALTAIGEGSNGKSVLLTVLERSAPPGTVVSLAPQTWGNEYRLAMLAGKRLNIVNELPEVELFDTEVVKCVISGDPTTARHIREAPFRFRPCAGHIFSANSLFKTADATHGYWRRFIVLTFNNTVEEARQEEGLAQRLVDQEGPAIVVWAVEGARRLLAQGRYTIPPSATKALDAWRSDADPIRLFVRERLTAISGDQAGTRGKQAHAEYRAWAKENGYPTIAQNKFGSRLRAMGLHPRHTDRGALYPFSIGGDGASLFPDDADERRAIKEESRS